ncbi:MAG TPA: HAMP domain-containing sensor histidine kinase [Streptosporangiaceae bacterium]|jgi:signal transduction histidine kinase|nr:HAMP domain-containing sensor histidine kinase [Streptosporangiaceae bacterium]
MRNLRLSLRTRLTLIYGGLFLATATLLVALTYLLTTRAMESRFRIAVSRSDFETGPLVGGAPGTPPPDITRLRKVVNEQTAAQQQAILHDLLQNSLLTVFALCLLAVVLGYLVAGRTLRPLQTVTATARRLSESTLHERIGLSGPRDEIKELADTFDGMLDRLHRAFDLQRRFIANASHELRTPLAINRAVIEVQLAKPDTSDETRALGRKLLVATARHERLIEGLLLLARSERELSGRTPVDAAALAQDAIDEFGAAAERAGVRVTSALSAAPTTGDVVLLERCVANLVENAIKYNRQDGRVWVLTGEAGGWSYVRVENTGPTVTAADTATIFEPFRRLTRDRVGSARGAGLGLSIVRAVVRAHGGTIAARPRPSGGLAITVRLPTSQVAAAPIPAAALAAGAGR